jgi:hypothetical protein
MSSFSHSTLVLYLSPRRLESAHADSNYRRHLTLEAVKPPPQGGRFEIFKGLNELDKTNSKSLAKTYVFYDYKEHQFCIRGASNFYKNNVKINANIFSFEGYHKDTVFEFLKDIFDSYSNLTVCLLSYSDAPINSEDITYDYLDSRNGRELEISGFNYKSGEYSIKNGLKTHLQILEDIYSKY